MVITIIPDISDHKYGFVDSSDINIKYTLAINTSEPIIIIGVATHISQSNVATVNTKIGGYINDAIINNIANTHNPICVLERLILVIS